jgi:anaerobic magnesium-protoporphyrin IX monomethyl ester cyclase
MMPAKITLIDLPFNHIEGKFASKAVYTEPPLGVTYLASFLRQKFDRRDLEVRLLDAAILQLDLRGVLDYVLEENPEIVGLSTVTLTAAFAKKLIEGIKARKPDTFVVVGGHHPSALPEDLLPGADAAVIGEGEATLGELVEARLGGTDWSSVAGIAYARDGEHVRTEPRPYIENLDAVPFPARDLLPMHKYFHQYPYRTRTKFYATMVTSRGCPYNCTFCGVKNLWSRKVRYRSVENCLAEVDELYNRYHVSCIQLYDDCFTVNRKRVMEFCHGLIERKYDLKWGCFARCNNVDREMLGTLKQAGCVELQIGVESGDEAVLKGIDKELKIDTIRHAFRITKEAGLNTKAFFMIGNPGETPETIRKTIDLAKELEPTYAMFSVLIPFPGIPTYDEYKARGFIKTFDWSKYNWYSDPVFETDTLSAKDMVALRRRAEMEFYLRPRRVLKHLYDGIRAGKVKTLQRNFFAWLSIVLPQRDSRV